jgi:hypothetical protein
MHRQSAILVQDKFNILNEYSDTQWFEEAVQEHVVRALLALSVHEKREALKYLLPALRLRTLDWRVWMSVAKLSLPPAVGEALGRVVEQLMVRSYSSRSRLASWLGRAP